MVKNHRIAIYVISVSILCISIIGINNIGISGSIIEDMPKKTEFFKDIKFFETEFEIQAGLGPIDSTKTGPN